MLKSLLVIISITTCLLIAGCSPEVGSEAWCKQLEGKPKGEWTGNEASEYAKNCLLP